VWRSGGCRPNISVATPFVWRCLCLTGLPRSSRAPRLLSGACGSVSTAFQSAGTVSGIANTAEDHRAADLIKHTVSGLVGQRVFGIALGYEDLIVPAFCRPKASSMLADRAPMEDHAVGRDRFAEKPLLATQRPHSNIARLANGLVGDARALAGDLTALTSA